MHLQAGPYTIALREPRGEAALVLSGQIGRAIDQIGLLDLLTAERMAASEARRRGEPYDEALVAESDKALAIACTRIGSLPDATSLAAATFAGSTISGPDMPATPITRAVVCEVFGSLSMAWHLWPAVLSAWLMLGFFGVGATSESAAQKPDQPAPSGVV